MWAHAFAQPLPGLVLRRSQGPRPWNCPGATGARFFQLLTIAAHDWHANGMRNVRYAAMDIDRKSTRLNSSHVRISYAVFCLKKKNCISSQIASPLLSIVT